MKRLAILCLFLLNPLMIDQYSAVKEKIAYKKHQIAKTST